MAVLVTPARPQPPHPVPKRAQTNRFSFVRNSQLLLPYNLSVASLVYVENIICPDTDTGLFGRVRASFGLDLPGLVQGSDRGLLM